jgi:uncharacterized protein (UPF0332 family)
VDALRGDLSGQLLLLVLFGSKARGDDQAGADLDFLVITEGDPRELQKRLASTASAIDLEHDVLVNPIVFSRERWADFARRQAAFWQNAQRDGMLMLRSARAPEELVSDRPDSRTTPPDHRPEVAAYMGSAWQALRTAESQFVEGKDYQVVANRAYYAVFYAANAALATRGLQRSKHPGVLKLFREHFVKGGAMEPGCLRDYEETMKRRHLSDYDLNALVTADFVRVGLEAAQRFTSRVERFLADCGFAAG